MVLENDTRGWIMAATSGIACTFGASVICVDLLVRQLPGKRGFKIQDSNAFLSAGLSISFGVMICSSLYSMLPSANRYLQKGGLAPRPAGVVLFSCFLAGALGIAVLSRIIHRFIPHSVIDCAHDHGDDEVDEEENLKGIEEAENGEVVTSTTTGDQHASSEANGSPGLPLYSSTHSDMSGSGLLRRPSIPARVSQFVTGQKQFCDEQGQCHGYSDPCGQECFKIVQQTRGGRVPHSPGLIKNATRPAGLRNHTAPQTHHHNHSHLPEVSETSPLLPTRSTPNRLASRTPSMPSSPLLNGPSSPSSTTTALKRPRSTSISTQSTISTHSHAHSHSHPPHSPTHPATHHHHVPTNVFLSLSFQTSIAIALHKLPEGFITYATNHANPTLGANIFLALFIHNITEGFAMALPLYLAIHSRFKAIFASAVLGGLTQPLGAGIAALWFKVARQRGGGGGGEEGGKGDDGVGELVYGIMFAATAGIMAMVALQLFGESLDLTHSRKLCFGFAFAGIGILGLSSALTA